MAQQAPDPKTVYVRSWKRGIEQIKEQSFSVALIPQHMEYEAEVFGASGEPKYKLLVRHNPLGQFPYEYWGVELREILPHKKRSKKILGDNLLTEEGPGPGGDNFPRGDYVGYLYPIEEADNLFSTVATHKLWFYPIGSKRVIKVESFYLMIEVGSYKFSEKESGKLDSLNITLSFRNSYEPDKSNP